MRYSIRCIRGFACALLLSSCWVAAVDLEPYYRHLTEDGFNVTYTGTATVEGEPFSADWTYVTEVISDSGGVLETKQTVVVDLGGMGAGTAVDSFYQITDEGVLFLGTASTVSGFGFTTTTEVTVDGESIVFPRNVDVPGEVLWEATFQTSVDLGFGSPFVTSEQVSERLEFIGFETVTVPIGTYNALKMRVYDTSGDGETLVGTNWLAEGIGLIRAELREEQEGDDGVELIDYVLEATSINGEVPNPSSPVDFLFAGAQELAGTLFQDWLGYISQVEGDLFYHYGFGYLTAVQVIEDGSLWIYSPNAAIGYMYMNPALLTAIQPEEGLPSGDLTGWVWSTGFPGGWMYFYVTSAGVLYAYQETADGQFQLLPYP